MTTSPSTFLEFLSAMSFFQQKIILFTQSCLAYYYGASVSLQKRLRLKQIEFKLAITSITANNGGYFTYKHRLNLWEFYA